MKPLILVLPRLHVRSHMCTLLVVLNNQHIDDDEHTRIYLIMSLIPIRILTVGLLYVIT